MADWTSTLPAPAVAGADTHIEDHDALTAAIAEARTVIDAAEAAIEAVQSLIGDKADSAALEALTTRVTALEDTPEA